MKVTFPIIAGLVAALAACGSVEREIRGEVVVYGKAYTTVTREFEQNGQTVLSGAVIYNNKRYGCNTLLPGDCERRVVQLFDADPIGRNAFGTIPSTYVITDPNKPAVRPIRISL